MVVAQLVERLLPDVSGSNPVSGKLYIEHLFTVKMKIKKKRLGMAHLKNI